MGLPTHGTTKRTSVLKVRTSNLKALLEDIMRPIVSYDAHNPPKRHLVPYIMQLWSRWYICMYVCMYNFLTIEYIHVVGHGGPRATLECFRRKKFSLIIPLSTPSIKSSVLEWCNEPPFFFFFSDLVISHPNPCFALQPLKTAPPLKLFRVLEISPSHSDVPF